MLGEGPHEVRFTFDPTGESRGERFTVKSGDQVTVLSGVEPGQEVVTSGAFKLRDGAAVTVDNAVQPGNSPTATPEDN